MTNLPTDKDVDYSVELSSKSEPRKDFNLGLILGKTDVITIEDRVKFYASLPEMIEAGFNTEDTIYKAAQLYFSQDENLGANIKGVYIGCVGADEKYIDALLDCREKETNWYAFSTADEISEADIEKLAETTQPIEFTYYFANASIPEDKNDALAQRLKTKAFTRTALTYHESSIFSCGIMGYAMGATTGLQNSAFTLKFKQVIGAEPSKLNSSQVNKLEAANANLYVQRRKAQFEQGVCVNGNWIDEQLNIDKLVYDIVANAYDLLYSVPKIDQTEAGHTDTANALSQACKQAKKIKFIAPGKWRKKSILGLNNGDTLPDGYLILWEPVDEQSDYDREQRNSQPFYICIVLAGAVHCIVVKVTVSR